MKELMLSSSFIGITISLIFYQVGVLLKNRFNKAIFNPLLIAILLVGAFLILFNIDYETYNSSAKYLAYLLTPATVSLAIPLYRQIDLLKKHHAAIFIGILSGVITSLMCILVMCMVFSFTHEQYVTLLPKSITTAIGIGITEELGGYVSICATVIIFTGLIGNMFADKLCDLFRIKNPISRGLAIGTSTHAMGTAKAVEIGEIEAAMSSLSIVVAGVMTVIGANIFAVFY